MSTYCGKDCENCAERIGCRCEDCDYARQKYGCEIAECCMRKSHESCVTCTQNSYCELYKQRKTMLEARLRKNQQLYEKSQLLAKWLFPLFYLMIVSMVFDLIPSSLINSSLVLSIISTVASLIIILLYTYFLYKIRPASDRYGRAAKFRLISAGLVIIASIINSFNEDIAALAILISIPTVVISFLAVYQEYTAHSDVLVGIDNELSDNWSKLWKWYIGLCLGNILLPIVGAFGILGVFILIAYMIALIIISVLQFVYLHRTAVTFRDMYE
ncbi:MAG: DUF3795 domain-containing protein [Clostridiales bacterium]|nr:DUF3795 domain-containing protein [Clostridiales bacterium]